MADLRPATMADLPGLMALAHLMHAESRFRTRPLSESRTADLIASLIQSPDGIVLVADDAGQLVGGLVGVVCDHWFTECRVAYEYAVFVTPDSRGGRLAVRIVQAFQREAKARGASIADMGITTGVHAERTGRLYQYQGFEHIGPVYSKEL